MTLKASKLTPNLIVSSVERSLAFYTDVLGFSRAMTVPDESPFVFASVTSGAVEIFFNDKTTVTKENPQFAGLSIGGGGNTMFIEVEQVDALHDRIKPQAAIVMAIHTQWYGTWCESAITDPDGYVITFAERVEKS